MIFGFEGSGGQNFNNGNFAPELIEREYKSSIILKSLYLHNFKSFYNSKFEFGKLNCLIAPNNTGKSNLIEALKFLDILIYRENNKIFKILNNINQLRNYHYKDKLAKIDAKFKIKNMVLVGSELIVYDINLLFSFSFDFESKSGSTDIIIDGKVKAITIDKADLRNGLGLRIFENFPNHIKNLDFYLKKLNKKYYEAFGFTYNGATLNYSISGTRYQKSEDIVQKLLGLNISNKNKDLLDALNFQNIFNKNSLFISHYFHVHDIKRLQDSGFDYLLENGTNLSDFLKNLDKETFNDISTSLIGEVELINSIEIKGESIPEIVFNEEVNGKTYPIKLQKVSDGTIHFVAIMSALIGNKHSIGMMIEEPERHMHMKVLSCILNTMRDDDKQIFFTTHSTEMLSALELDEIIFMFRDFNGDTKGIRAKEIKNIKKIMKIYKNDIVEMIKIGILDGLEDELL